MVYNILNCRGWETVDSIGLSFGTCMQAKLFAVFIFFILALFRKWGAEMFGLSYNFIISQVAGLLVYVIIVSLTGATGLSFILGLVAGIAGGFIGGMFFPDGE